MNRGKGEVMNAPILPVEKYEAIYRKFESNDDPEVDIQRHIDERGSYFRMLEGALSALPEGSCVIELGCGTGMLTWHSDTENAPVVVFILWMFLLNI
jgi:hypothetical protein